MKKKWEVHRETYSVIDIEAETYKEAEDMLSEIDGDDDGWEYYNEEIYLRDFSKHTYPNYDEYSMTHTVDRDDDVNEDNQVNNCIFILSNKIETLEDDNENIWSEMDNISRKIVRMTLDTELSNRIKALENNTFTRQKNLIKNLLNRIGELEKLTQKLIDIQVNEDVDRHDDLTDELWNYKK